MERLTEEKQIGPFAALKDKAEAAPGAFGSYDCLYAHMVAATLLKQYEDTMPLERAQELARAEKDGRLVVLPCKKGDTLWSYYDYPTLGISKIAVTAVSTLDGITVINTDNYGVIEEKDIGETVFLTSEEAETALKKREDWMVRSEPWNCCGTMAVKLERKPGGYTVDGLDLVREADNEKSNSNRL